MRIYLTISYYLTFVYAVSHLFLWVLNQDSLDVLTIDERGKYVAVMTLTLAFFTFVSEIHEDRQGLRADLLDQILGRK